MQGVGRYNNLLNGEIEDRQYKENTLYSVNSKGYCEIVENPEDYITVDTETNKVYCCGKITNYDNYGKIIVAPYAYSTTSEFANLAFILRGPFYADITEVTITYD